MVSPAVMASSPLTSVIVDPGGRPQTIRSPALAEWIASRSDPGPLSLVFVTMGVAALTNPAAPVRIKLTARTLRYAARENRSCATTRACEDAWFVILANVSDGRAILEFESVASIFVYRPLRTMLPIQTAYISLRTPDVAP